MFRRLRWRLTGLYLMAATLLAVVLGGGAYQLLSLYFQSTTDLALQHVMAVELQLREQSLPRELAEANASWYAGRSREEPQATMSSGESPDEENEESEHGGSGNAAQSLRDAYAIERANDSELATIFILPLAANGSELAELGFVAPITADQDALAQALANGSDLRTVQAADGSPVRLLTYRLNKANGIAALQVGRSLRDQARVLNQLLTTLLILSAVSAVFVGVGSWWLAGRAMQTAQDAWTRQQSFISNASHELRTPLTLVRASTEVALREIPDGEGDARMLLRDVLDETDHMARLVDDLLTLSRLDSGRLTLEREAVSLDGLLADVERQMGRVAEATGVTLTAEAEPGEVKGDATRLRQVLLILLDNALRHTPAGGAITLEGRRAARRYQIVVSDTGAGIAPEHLPHVFERFYRADEARTARPNQNNSGLGLSIARALIQAHGGQIEIASTLGKGTRVTVSLPLSHAP